ncbi:MAG: type II toxin-antitoxin system RelE/ParE family toxin [Candidatus Sungbacteria bacterium]|uniref:Type II toxin-antitoxin system RelE/ParE family toxin n=1 Tax=Candidatus Sungiibacteriota bacterium TaxID=2750080 RepID=A0A932VQT2_9BACT|nr:type II toxin-antitoxin system RelE/ParE family toxin [Candidatus Sungbacteria bacterium]
MSWHVVLTDAARKELRRLSQEDQARFDAVISAREENPFQGDIVKLGGESNRWRRRVGAYRILYNLVSDERGIFIYDIKKRTSKTY